jgi:hypothetical protein
MQRNTLSLLREKRHHYLFIRHLVGLSLFPLEKPWNAGLSGE